jgi:hypothetical protein
LSSTLFDDDGANSSLPEHDIPAAQLRQQAAICRVFVVAGAEKLETSWRIYLGTSELIQKGAQASPKLLLTSRHPAMAYYLGGGVNDVDAVDKAK